MDNKGNHPQLALFQVRESFILLLHIITISYIYIYCSCSRLIHHSPSIHPAFLRGQFALQWRLGSHAQALDVWLFTVLWLCDAQHRLHTAPWRARMDGSQAPRVMAILLGKTWENTHTHTYIMSMYDYVYEHIMRLETLDFGVRGSFVWTKPSWISQVLTKRIKDSFKTKLSHPHFWTGLQQLQPSEAK